MRTSILTPAVSSTRVAASLTATRGMALDDVLRAGPSCCLSGRLRRVSIKPPCGKVARALGLSPALSTRSLYAISGKRVLLVQRNVRIDNDAVLQHDQPDIASCQRFADKVGATFIRDMTTAGNFTREDTGTFREFCIAIRIAFDCLVHIRSNL